MASRKHPFTCQHTQQAILPTYTGFYIEYIFRHHHCRRFILELPRPLVLIYRIHGNGVPVLRYCAMHHFPYLSVDLFCSKAHAKTRFQLPHPRYAIPFCKKERPREQKCKIYKLKLRRLTSSTSSPTLAAAARFSRDKQK